MKRRAAHFARRIRSAVCVCFVGMLASGGVALAESASVPEDVQATLLSKVALFDKHFVERAGDRARVLVLKRSGVADSEFAATNLVKALQDVKAIGGLAHEELVIAYTTAEKLAEECRARRAAIVFITPGFGDQIGAIATALSGVDVLSVTSVADYVPKGVVVGFDLVSGRPKLLVHMPQARSQNVVFSAEVLRLMRLFP